MLFILVVFCACLSSQESLEEQFSALLMGRLNELNRIGMEECERQECEARSSYVDCDFYAMNAGGECEKFHLKSGPHCRMMEIYYDKMKCDAMRKEADCIFYIYNPYHEGCDRLVLETKEECETARDEIVKSAQLDKKNLYGLLKKYVSKNASI